MIAVELGRGKDGDNGNLVIIINMVVVLSVM